MGLRSEVRSAIQQAVSAGKLNPNDEQAVVGFINDYASQAQQLKADVAQRGAINQELTSRGISPTVYRDINDLRAARERDTRVATAQNMAAPQTPALPHAYSPMPPPPLGREPQTVDELVQNYQPGPNFGAGADTSAAFQAAQAALPPRDLRRPTDEEAQQFGLAQDPHSEDVRKAYEYGRANPAKARYAVRIIEGGAGASFGASRFAEMWASGRDLKKQDELKQALLAGAEETGGPISKYGSILTGGALGSSQILAGGGGVARTLAGRAVQTGLQKLPNVLQRGAGYATAGALERGLTPEVTEAAGGQEAGPVLPRIAEGAAGGASMVAGSALASRLPGALAKLRVPTMLAGDTGASGAVSAAFAPEGQGKEAFTEGAITGLLGSAMGLRGELAHERARLAGLEQSRQMRAGMPESDVRRLAPAEVNQFFRPPPESMRAERLPTHHAGATTLAEDIQISRIRERAERLKYAQVTPETYPDLGPQPHIDTSPGRMSDEPFREQTATTHQLPPRAPMEPTTLPERFQQVLRGVKEGELTGLGLPDRLKDIKERFGIGRDQARQMIVDEINRRSEPVTIRDLEESVEPSRANRIRAEVNKAARAGGLDKLRYDIRARNLGDAERRLYEAHLDRDVSRMVGDSGPVMEAYGGLPIPKAVRDAVESVVNFRNPLKAYADYPTEHRAAEAKFEAAQIKMADRLPLWARRLFDLPSAHKEVREFKKWSDQLRGDSAVKVAKFSSILNSIDADEARTLHYSAEADKPMSNPRAEEARQMLKEVVNSEADEYVKAEIYDPQVLAKYQREGEAGYVTRFPSKQALKDAFKKGIFSGIKDVLTGKVGSDSSSATGQRIYYDAQLGKSADAATTPIRGKLAGRKQISLADAEKQGYEIGKGPLAATMRLSSKISTTLQTMRRFKETMPQYWKDAPAHPEGAGKNYKAEIPSGWRLADGEGWGVLNGKLIRTDVYGDLVHVANPAESGWYKLAEVLNRGVKTATVFTGLGSFFVKTQMLLNVMSNGLAGLSPERAPKRLIQAHRVMQDWFQRGKMHPVIEALLRKDQLAESRVIQDALEGQDRRALGEAANFRDIEGGKGYLGRLAGKAGEDLNARLELIEKRAIADEGAGGRWAYRTAEVMQAFMDAMSGVDARKVVGKGGKIRLSMEGLLDLATYQDNLSKVALALELTESGGGPLGSVTLKNILGKRQGKFSPDEAADVSRDFYDVRSVPASLKVVANVPVIGQAFVRWPYLYARNLVAKGYATRNPIMGALWTAPAAALTAAYMAATGESAAEVEEKRKASGASETSAPMKIPGTDQTIFIDTSDMETAKQVLNAVNPATGVKAGPGGGFDRFVRGAVSKNPLGRYLYERTGRSTYTGKFNQNTTPLDAVPPLPIPGLGAAKSIARRRQLTSDLEARGQVPMETEGEFWTQMFSGINAAVVPDKNDPRYWQNLNIMQRREDEQRAWEDGAEAIVRPREESRGGRRGSRRR